MMKNIGIGLGITLALLSLYFGAYAPYEKAKLYVTTQRNLPLLTTLESIEEAFGRVFDYRSPVGQEETVRFFIELVQGTVASNQIPEVVQRELTAYAERRVLEGDVVQIVQIGNTYDMLWRHFGRNEYLDKAEEYYGKALAIGPDLPQGLYGLFSLYGAAGDTAKLEEIGRRILTVWPDDARVKEVLDALAKSR